MAFDGFNETPGIATGGADFNVYDANTIALLRALPSAGHVDENVFRVKSYAGKGTAGRRDVVWDAASLAADDGVSVFKPDDILAANPGRYIHVGRLTARHAGFSVRNTIAENDVAFLRLCLASGQFDFENRKYPVSVKGVFGQAVKAKWFNGGINSAALVADGTAYEALGPDMVSLGSLQANGLQSDRAVQIPNGNEALVEAGRIVMVHSDRPWNAETALASELKQVLSTAAGVLNFGSHLRDEYLTGVHNPRVAAFNTELSLEFEDFTFEGDYARDHNCFVAYRFALLSFVRCTFKDFRERCVQAEMGLRLFGRDCEFINADLDGLGYGYVLGGGIWICDLDRTRGVRCRHLLTSGDGSDFTGSNTPSRAILRRPNFGDLHCIDALGSIRDTHPGVDEPKTGKVTGNMSPDATAESVTTHQGTRETNGPIEVNGMSNVGVLIQSVGCGDKGAKNYYRFGRAIIEDNGVANNTDGILVENIDDSTNQPIEEIYFEELNIEADNGGFVKALHGDINNFKIGKGAVTARTNEGLYFQYTANYRTKEIDLGDCDVTGARYGVWMDDLVWYDNNRSAAGALDWASHLQMDGANIHGINDHAIRSENSLVSITAKTRLTSGNAAKDLVRMDLPTGSSHRVACVRVDGVAAMKQTDTVTANEIYALLGAIVKVPGGTTINKINIVDDTGTVINGRTEYITGTVTIMREDGTSGNVTITHDAAAVAGEVTVSSGSNIVLDNDADVAECVLGAFSEHFTAWNEGVI